MKSTPARLLTALVFCLLGCNGQSEKLPDTRPAVDLTSAADSTLPDLARPDLRPDLPLPDSTAAPKKLKVLFIGNSYTFVNDLPAMFTKVVKAATKPPQIVVDSATGGGLMLQAHWNNAATLSKIDTGGWTHVVLQGQSLEPVCAYITFGTYAKKLGDRVKKAGATPVFFETWARKKGSPDYKQWPCAGADPAAMQKGLREAYGKAAKATGGIVAPVGDAWEKVLGANPTVALHSGDGSHPSVAGTYLAACVFHVTLTRQKSLGNSFVPPGISAAQAKTLQKAADATMKQKR